MFEPVFALLEESDERVDTVENLRRGVGGTTKEALLFCRRSKDRKQGLFIFQLNYLDFSFMVMLAHKQKDCNFH